MGGRSFGSVDQALQAPLGPEARPGPPGVGPPGPPGPPGPSTTPSPKLGKGDGAAWTIKSGDCTISEGGACIQSPNFPESYVKKDSCEIDVVIGTKIKAEYFNTEASYNGKNLYDILTVNGNEYGGNEDKGSPFPTDWVTATSPTIKWSSDVSTEKRGWQLCTE